MPSRAGLRARSSWRCLHLYVWRGGVFSDTYEHDNDHYEHDGDNCHVSPLPGRDERFMNAGETATVISQHLIWADESSQLNEL